MNVTENFCSTILLKPLLQPFGLYYFDRPSFSFVKQEKKENGRSILISSPTATWKPISIEVSQLILVEPSNWVENKEQFDFLIRVSTEADRPVEEWLVENSQIINFHPRRARAIDREVLNVNIRYKMARRLI